MKVLVTGAGGFLGQYVLDSLRRHDIGVVVVGRKQPRGIEDKAFVQADLLAPMSFSELIAVSAPTHLLHLAWYAEHGKYWTSPLNLRWVEATVKLAEAFCRTGGQRVVMAGTCAEYDWAHGYCREDSTPLNPTTLYGVAKDAARRLVMAVCGQYQVPCAWGRVFLPFGAGESSQRLIPSLISALKGTRPPFAVDAMAYRDFLHASDVAEAFTTLLRADVSAEYNLSSAKATQIAQVVRDLARLLDAAPEPILDLAMERPGEPRLLLGDNLRLGALGWQPRYSLLEGLKRTICDLPEDTREFGVYGSK